MIFQFCTEVVRGLVVLALVLIGDKSSFHNTPRSTWPKSHSTHSVHHVPRPRMRRLTIWARSACIMTDGTITFRPPVERGQPYLPRETRARPVESAAADLRHIIAPITRSSWSIRPAGGSMKEPKKHKQELMTELARRPRAMIDGNRPSQRLRREMIVRWTASNHDEAGSTPGP